MDRLTLSFIWIGAALAVLFAVGYDLGLKLAVADPKAEEVDELMAMFDRDDMPGAALVVVRDGDVVLERGYGLANLEYGAPITPETVFHVASISKQFTAFAMVLLAQEGHLSLDDDIRTHLPELPDFGERITIRHLIHHTSGIRDQWTLWAMAGGRMDDVITQENLLSLIRQQRELNFAPGAAHVYSNSGYMLMAEIVERVTGERFRDWMEEHVFEPLGMQRTQVYDNHERLVEGRAYSYRYGGDGTFRKAVLSYANAGATSLFTTAEDLTSWLANFRDGTVGGQEAVAQMQEQGVLTRGDTLRYAFGLVVEEHEGLGRFRHGGADAGYRAHLAYYPEIDGGVILLANIASFPVQPLGDRVAEIYFEDAMTPAAGHSSSAKAFDPDTFEAFEGRYRGADGDQEVMYFATAGRYFEQVGVGPVKEIFPESATLFTYADGEPAVTFQPDRDGRVERALHPAGDTLRKLPVHEPADGELEEYLGMYYSPELQTQYEVVLVDGELRVVHRRHPAIRLDVRDKDLFRGDKWFFSDVRFERDEAGGVEAMRVSSSRVHHLRFERVSGASR